MADSADPSYSKAMDIVNKYNVKNIDEENNKDASSEGESISAAAELHSASDVLAQEEKPLPLTENSGENEEDISPNKRPTPNIVIPTEEESESEYDDEDEIIEPRTVVRSVSIDRIAAIRPLAATGPKEPDPSSERDIENASPETTNLCGQFECHYCIFLYSRPCDVDEDTLPFRLKACLEDLKKTNDEEKKKKLNKNTMIRDAKRDKRLASIEIRTECKIRLSELNGKMSMIRGLPRRRLTIAGPTFSHICMAIQLIEYKFPRIMQFALYPYRLPPHCSTNLTSEEKLNYSYKDYVDRQPSCLSLRPVIDDRGGWRRNLTNPLPKEA